MSDTPRDPSGEPLCVWCGGEIKQSGVGRRKDYCSRTHREYAYRARREMNMKLRAYTKGRADERTVSSTDEIRPKRVTSVDETKPAGPAPAPAQPAGRARPQPRPAPPPLPPRPSRRRQNMTTSAMPLPFEQEDADGE